MAVAKKAPAKKAAPRKKAEPKVEVEAEVEVVEEEAPEVVEVALGSCGYTNCPLHLHPEQAAGYHDAAPREPVVADPESAADYG